MTQKDTLVVLDFDGFLINSYELLKHTFAQFGLDIGDEERFSHRRKFLKYIGGGKEFLGNLVSYSLPKKKKIREALTELYAEEGRIYNEFCDLINRMISDNNIHVGIVSRNFTYTPGPTIRKTLQNSGVDEAHLDFVIPLPVGVKKHGVLAGMHSSRYQKALFGGDEIGDYKAASETGYGNIMIGSYGFDNKERLINSGGIPEELIYDDQKSIVKAFEQHL